MRKKRDGTSNAARSFVPAAALRSKLLTALPAVAGAVGLLAAPAQGALAPPPQPPELKVLEQHMSELTVTSQRIAGKETVSGRLPRPVGKVPTRTSEFSGEESISPAFANVTLKLSGRSLTLLQIGNVLYTHDQSIAAHDGGRPWVLESLSSKAKQFGSRPGLGSPSIGGGSDGLLNPTPFKSDAELIAQGTSIRTLGPSTVDGQATVGFAGVVTPRRLAASVLSKKQIAALRHKRIKFKASFEVFIAANGVPVHMNVLVTIAKLRVGISEDVLATDFPATAPAPPPPAETIGAAELEKIETARLKKLLKKLKKHHK